MTDGDGFSDPDPADIPEELEEIDPDDWVIHDGSLSCDDCIHQDVCKIHSGFAQMVFENGQVDEEPAVSPDDLAVVCDEYLPEDDEDAPLAEAER